MCEDAWRWQNKNPHGYEKNQDMESPHFIPDEDYFIRNKLRSV
jgi:hypothetical protein